MSRFLRRAGRAGADATGATGRLARAALAALALAMLVAGPAAAQETGRTPERRLDGRLDEATRLSVVAQVDSARRAGLPVDPLVERALEGASKRATGRPVTGADIVAAVHRLRQALGTARTALGTRASTAELAAGASALQANVGVSTIAALRRARPEGSLTVPLSVLTDLVAIGVPADTAARTVVALARTQDVVLLGYQRDVERDVGVGALPAVAASVRAAGLERATAGDLNTSAPGTLSPGTHGGGKRPPRKP